MSRASAVAAGVILILAASNIIASSMLGPGDAEALYFCYGRHPSLSYLDHPPLIGWLVGLATSVGGAHTLSLRAVSLTMMALAVLFTFLLTRDAFGEKAAMWSALLLFATPVFSIGMTAAAPDAPLAALWTLFTWQLHKALADESPGRFARTVRPLLLGTVLGLAFLAKYTGACLVVTVLYMLSRKEHRAWLGRPAFFAGASIAAALASPVFIWNASNGWAGLVHRLVSTQIGAGFSIENAAKLIGGQLLYLGPFTPCLFVLAIAAAIRERPSGRALVSKRLMLAAAIPALSLTYLLGLWSDVAEPHWPAAGYLSLFPLTAAFIANASSRIRRLAKCAVGFGATVFAIMHVAVLTPLWPMLSPADSYAPKHDLANELRGWDEAAETIRAMNPERVPVTAAFYTQCGQLAFSLSRPNDPPVRCVSKEIDDFDLWYGPFELPEKGAFFVTDNRFDHDVSRLFLNAELSPPLTLEITRAGRWVRRFEVIKVTPKVH